jgi:TPR repeat protein
LRAFSELGVCYDAGMGVPRDPARGAKLLELGANLGNSSAAWNLAGAYQMGVGIERNPALAQRYYARAAELGD